MTAPDPSDAEAESTGAPPEIGLDAARPRRRWLAPAALAGAALIAVVVGLVLVVGRDPDAAVVPSTGITTPDAATTIGPATTATHSATTVVDTTVPDAATTTDAPGTTTVPQSTAATSTTVVVPDASTGVVASGRDGVWIVGRDGTRVQWWDQPAAFAARSPDGSVILQVHRRGDACTIDGTCTPTDTAPVRLVGPNADPMALSEDLPVGWMRLHDAARLLDGRMVALVEWQTTVDQGLYTEPGRLYAVDVRTGDVVTVVDVFGGWEEGSSRLHLAETGLVVGEYSSSITRSWFSAVVPGGPPLTTETLGAPAVGLEPFYDDCADCPQLYAIDRTGTIVAWIHGDDLVIRSLTTGIERRSALDGRGDGASDIDVELQVVGDPGGPPVVAIEHRWSSQERPAVVLLVGADGVTEWDVGAPDQVSL